MTIISAINFHDQYYTKLVAHRMSQQNGGTAKIPEADIFHNCVNPDNS